jgi:hypothetical protein
MKETWKKKTHNSWFQIDLLISTLNRAMDIYNFINNEIDIFIAIYMMHDAWCMMLIFKLILVS